MHDEILKRLFTLQDSEYQIFQQRLIPTVPPESIIGVRTPALRQYARELCGSDAAEDFLSSLPHSWFDENQLHAFLLSMGKDYETTLRAVDAFLPYVDNWATCDQLSPRVFRAHHKELLDSIGRWLASRHPYTVRFGVGMLMQHYLDEDFDPSYPERVAALQSGEYYVNMMRAWYFASALTKQWDAAIPFIERERLDVWTHNKAIQKAIESLRVSDERKNYLRTKKIKKGA